MLRFLLVASLAAGCASHAASGPAWPKPHASENDGGESLAPHVRSESAAAIETADDDAKPVAAAPAAPAAATPASDPAAPAVAPPEKPGDDTTIIIDDVVIQIDE